MATISELAPLPLRSVRDAASLLGVSPKTVRRLIARGDLEAVRIGSRVLIREADLKAFVA
jgi:excisionase family DNA binding protein